MANKHRGRPFKVEEYIIPILQSMLEDGTDADEFDKYLELLIEEFGKHQVRQWCDLIDSEIIID